MSEVVEVPDLPVETVDVAVVVGAPGAPGADGAPGVDGLPGAPGQDGADGASAYQVAVAQGFQGDAAAWLASLVGLEGPAGADGAPGTPGIDGADGAPGADGEDGASAYELAVAAGYVGPLPQWIASLKGEPGEPGQDGAPGADGADGVGVPAGGTTGQTLVKASDADHDTMWADGGTGGGGWARQTTTYTTGALASGATETGLVELAASWRLLRIDTDIPARVRLYSSTAKRDADLSRPTGTKPSGDHGRLFEAVLTTEVPGFDCSPTVDGFVTDGTTDAPITVTSTSPSGGVVTVTFEWIRTE